MVRTLNHKQDLGGPTKPILLIGLVTALLGACAALGDGLQPPQRPEAAVTSAEITALSFEAAELTARVRVDNPNAFGVTLAGISYALGIEDAEPLQGQIEHEIEIPPTESGSIEVPVRVAWAELYDSVRVLADRNETAYSLELTPVVAVPVLGRMELPLRTKGSLPLLRLPELGFAGIEVRSLGLTTAELGVSFELNNPNSVALSLHELPYDLELGGRRVASGNIADIEGIEIEGAEGTEGEAVLDAEGRARYTVVASLAFIEAGRAVWETVAAREPLAYRLEGALTFGVALPLVEPTTIPFSFSGSEPPGAR